MVLLSVEDWRLAHSVCSNLHVTGQILYVYGSSWCSRCTSTFGDRLMGEMLNTINVLRLFCVFADTPLSFSTWSVILPSNSGGRFPGFARLHRYDPSLELSSIYCMNFHCRPLDGEKLSTGILRCKSLMEH